VVSVDTVADAGLEPAAPGWEPDDL